MPLTSIGKIICLLIFVVAGVPATAGESYDNDTVLARKYLRERGEVYFSFEAGPNELRHLGNIMSIDNYSAGRVFANAGPEEFEVFLKRSKGFKVISPEFGWYREDPLLKSQWDDYPSYSEYVEMMQVWASEYPDICEYIDAGSSIEGRSILFLRITGNKPAADPKPRFMYTSSMHGDETVGFVLMLRLIEYLLANYPVDGQVERLLDNLEIWINPLANPDGTYFGGDGNTIITPKRRNANNTDLNRNFPQLNIPDYSTEGLEPETTIMIDLMDSLQFSLSANLHGGAEVMNYPWDYWQRRHPDDLWFEFICREFADTSMYYSPPGYMTFLGGVTNGYDWYSVTGSRQDFVTYFTGGREVTMEISNSKHPPPDSLGEYWNYNRRSLLNYMEQARFGIRGMVSDAVTGGSLSAGIEILSHDNDSSHIYSDISNGWYFRYLAEGTYDLRVSADGYYSRTLEMVEVRNYESVRLDIQLDPVVSGSELPAIGDDNLIIIYPSPAREMVSVRIEIQEPSLIHIDVFDRTGRKYIQVFMGRAEKGTNIFTFKTVNFPSGVYILRMQYGSSFISRNFVISH